MRAVCACSLWTTSCMKFRYTIKRTLEISQDVLAEKIDTYLTNNAYRITERGPGYVIFVEDEYSNRRGSRADFHRRLQEGGKFVFTRLTDTETHAELIYFTSIAYPPVLLAILFGAFGIYTHNIIMPVILSCVLTLPILYRIFYLNEHVFEDVMEG